MKFSGLVPIVAILLFTALIRLLPSIYTGTFFSNDVWPLVHLARRVLENPNLGIYSLAEAFGHHAEYPLSTLECVVYAIVTGVPIEWFFMFIGVAMLSSAMFVLVYTFAGRLASIRGSRLLASLAISSMPSFAIYTSAYLKEFYGYTLIPLILYLAASRENKLRGWLALSILSTALVLSHPLASAMCTAVLFSAAYADFAWKIRARKPLELSSRYLVCCMLLFSAFAIYSTATTKLPLRMSAYDLSSLGLYAVAVYLAYLFLGRLGSSLLMAFAALPAVISLLYTVTAPISVVPFALYIVPLISSATYKSAELPAGRLRAGVLLPIATIFLYILSYAVEAVGIVHRVANYLVFALILMSISLGESNSRSSLAVFTLLAVITAGCTATVTLGEDPYTFYWRYGEYDVVLGDLVKLKAIDAPISGDPKYAYMVPEVVEISPLTAVDLCRQRGLAVLSRGNYIYGVPISPVDFIKLPSSLPNCRSVVFNAGYLHVLS